jgi:hypothetical protein
MSWASKRQFKYFSIFILLIAIIVFLIIYPVLFKKPTCSDLKQNGTETGVDCGGSCSLMCKKDIVAPVVLWSRAFPVVGTNYNLVAFVENRNKTSGVISASYEFRIYDTNNKLLGRREGKTFIPPNQQFAVFEPTFDSGESKIKTVTFEFQEPVTWIKKFPTLQTLPISVKNIIFDDNMDTPRLSATVVNDSIYNIPEFDVIAILYDINKNAINASKTHKAGGLLSNKSLPITFTWPEVLSAFPVTEDVIVSINPFSVSF